MATDSWVWCAALQNLQRLISTSLATNVNTLTDDNHNSLHYPCSLSAKVQMPTPPFTHLTVEVPFVVTHRGV